MAKLDLTATDDRQQTVLEHLIPMVSDVLAEKINNGVYIEKDGKTLLNKKDLSTFMAYAAEQAKNTIAEQQRKGTQNVCIHGDQIMSWAIHYFEEDSIEGKLFNPDGTEYKPPAPVKKATTKPTAPATPPPKPKSQFSFFDLLNEKNDEQKTEVTLQPDDHEIVDNEAQQYNNPSVEQITGSLQQAVEQKQEIIQPPTLPTPQPKPKNELYEKYITYVNRHPDSVIAMRVGDFYEVCGKRAVEISNELNMTVTSRDLGLEQRIPVIGIPVLSCEVYFKKLRKKHSIVVVEPDGERKLDEFGIEDVLDGDDELTEEEMRLFDGDIQEPKDIPETAPASEQPKAACEPSTDPDSPYDEIALAKVVKLLGNDFILR